METNILSIPCNKCGRIVDKVDIGIRSVKCWVCVQVVVGFPKEPIQVQRSGRPAGWHFMAEFVDKDGTVFHKGKEQPKLKDTLPPTKISKKKKKSTKKSRRSKEQILIDRQKEKKAALKKAVKKQQDFISHKYGK